jgi:hypothetical protein
MLVTFPALVIQIMLTLTVAALCLQTYQRALIITREEEEKARLSSKQPIDRSTIEKVTSGESLDLSGSDEL